MYKYGKYFFIKKAHVDTAQNWFDKYGVKAVFFSRMLPIVRTFISLPAGFVSVDVKKFLFYTIAGSLPWTALILYAGMTLGENWQILMTIGHEASTVFIAVAVVIIAVLYIRYRRRGKQSGKIDVD